LLHYDALSFTAPHGWAEKSQFTFSYASVPGSAVIFVSHDSVGAAEAGEALTRLVWSRAMKFAKTVDGMELITSAPRSLHGRTGHELHLCFPSSVGPVEQKILAIRTGDADPAVTAFSVLALSASLPDVATTFTRFLESVRFDEEDARLVGSDNACSTRVHFRSLFFDRLPGWQTSTLCLYEQPDGPALVVMTEALPPGGTWDSYVSGKVTALSREKKEFRLLEQGELPSVNGRSARRLRFQLRAAASGELFDETMVLVGPGGQADRTATVFSTAAPTATAAIADGERALSDVLASARFGGASDVATRREPEPNLLGFWTPLPSNNIPMNRRS
jgi:hypothetical protein